MNKALETNLRPGTKLELIRARTRRRVRCTVAELVGTGGSAKVYAGTLDEDQTQVVLKCQRLEGPLDPALELEIGLLKRLNHRNIVPCVGMGVTRHGQVVIGFRRCYSNPLLLMGKEHVASEMLRDSKATYPHLPVDTAVDLAYELLRGLRYLEREGLVHHDVKLANLLIDPGPSEKRLGGRDVMSLVARRAYRAVLIDFGATRTHAELEAYNRGQLDGPPPQVTPIYAPPEAVVERRRDDGELGRFLHPSLDVYAAALVLYAMFTGHPPYSHLKQQVDASDLESVLGVKSAEGRGEVEPISQDVIQRVVYEGARFLEDRSAFDLNLFRFLRQRLSPDPVARGTVTDMMIDFAKLARIDDRRGESGGLDGERRKSQVYLPFQQGLVEPTSVGEHPLLRAARLYGETSRLDKSDLQQALPAHMTEKPVPRGPVRDAASGLVFVDHAPGAAPAPPSAAARRQQLATQALDRDELEAALAQARDRHEAAPEPVAPGPSPQEAAPQAQVPTTRNLAFSGSAGGLLARTLGWLALVAVGVPAHALALYVTAEALPAAAPLREAFALARALVGSPAEWPLVGPRWPLLAEPLTSQPPLVLWTVCALLLLAFLRLSSSIGNYRLSHTRAFDRPLMHRPGLGVLPLLGDALAVTLTAGLAIPWVILRRRRRAYRSFWAPSGAHVDFTGDARQVFQYGLLSLLALPLAVATLGLLGIPLAYLWHRWDRAHLRVPDTRGELHQVMFVGTLGGYVRHALLGWVATVLTLGLLRPWAQVRTWRWLDRHSAV